MNTWNRLTRGRLGEDRGFWIAVVVLLLLYAFVRTQSMLQLLYTLLALVAAITVHEFSHAWTASLLGDDTAKNVGRITLNPIAHLDPLGSAMMLITALTGLGIGWGKPVPVAPYRLRYGPRVGNGLVSLSGPASNLLAALGWAMLTRLAGAWAMAPGFLIDFLAYLVLINIVIAFFNLLPVPPLDGFGVLIGILGLARWDWTSRLADRMESLGRYGWMILFAVIIVSQLMGLGLLNAILGRPAINLFRILVG